MPIGFRLLDMKGCVWLKRCRYGKEFWECYLVSTGKRPKDSNLYRTHSYMARRKTAMYHGPIASWQPKTVRKEQ